MSTARAAAGYPEEASEFPQPGGNAAAGARGDGGGTGCGCGLHGVSRAGWHVLYPDLQLQGKRRDPKSIFVER